MKVVFHDDFYKVYTADPAAAAGRMEAIMAVIEPHVDIVSARPAKEKDILKVHSKEQVENVRRSGLYDIAALAAGGAIQTAMLGLHEPAFGCIRPPGHHASSGSSWGFCYFNNMAIALHALKHRSQLKNAYVLDIDLHYGDGTVNILESNRFVTVHNVKATDRQAYLLEIEAGLREHPVNLIGISAGFDLHRDDWGSLLWTEDYFEIGKLVKAAAERNGGGCFGLLEGGYNHEILGDNVMALLNGLMDR